MNEEQLEVLKMVGSEAKVKNLWLKVYDEEGGGEGLVSVYEILESILKAMEEKGK